MKIYCKCLNVIIESDGSNIEEIDVLTLDVPKDDFFKEGVGTVGLVKISKEQPVLVEMQSVGSWVIHRCLNCQTYTHALNRDKGAASLLVNKSLITDPDAITELKKSENFSPAFNIVINHTEDDDVFAKVSVTGRNQQSISALHQALTSFIQRESTLTEERVRVYTDQQSAALENLRVRAHRDHQYLTKVLNETKTENNSNSATGSTTTGNAAVRYITAGFSDRIQSSNFVNNTSTNAQVNNVNNPIVLASASAAIRKPVISTANKPKGTSQLSGGIRISSNGSSSSSQRKLSETGSQSNLSFDSEVLFPLEGMEDPVSDNYHTDEEQSDTDDSGSHDEGIHIPRRVDSTVYAKSLPVNVPTFLPHRSSHIDKLPMAPEDMFESTHDYSEHHRSPRQPMDIAASIKALAKSVHGDTVFGDLPRPRFSSQI